MTSVPESPYFVMMSNSVFFASVNLPLIACWSIVLISVGCASDAIEYIVSGSIVVVVAAQLWSVFSSFLQSPSLVSISACSVSFVSCMFSFCAICLIIVWMCSLLNGLNLKTAHLLCIGSIIFEL